MVNNVGLEAVLPYENTTYCQISNIRGTKSQTLNAYCIALQLSLSNPLKPGIKSRMKM